MLPVSVSSFQPAEERQSIPRLTKKKLKLLENTTALSIGEKVELLLIFLHRKWIAEVDIDLTRIDECSLVLGQLGLPWYIEHYDEPRVEWMQVGANYAVLDYVRERREQLSDLESGILYGFPLSHVLSYTNIISRHHIRPTGAAQYMLAGVYSREFHEEELDYFQKVWQEVKETSPIIAQKSQVEYESHYKIKVSD